MNLPNFKTVAKKRIMLGLTSITYTRREGWGDRKVVVITRSWHLEKPAITVSITTEPDKYVQDDK